MARANQNTAVVTEEDDDATGETRDVALTNGKDTANGKADDLYEVVEVDDGGKALKKAEAADADADDDDHHEDDAADRGREANLADEESDEGSLVERNSRRESRKSRRDRQRTAREKQAQEIADLKNQVRELRTGRDEDAPRLARIEKRFSQEAADKLEAGVVAAEAAMAAAKKDIAKALREGDEDAITNALDVRDKAFIRQMTAQGARDKYKRDTGTADEDADDDQGDDHDTGRRQTRQADAAPKLSIDGRRYLDKFTSANKWFDADGKNDDSQLALVIDSQVRRAGFNPNTSEYWEELEKRLTKALPHRFEADDEEDEDPAPRRSNGKDATSRNGRDRTPPERRGPLMNGQGDQRPAGGRNQVKITPQRKDALIQANVLGPDGKVIDQPKLQRMLKQYAEYDRQNAGQSR